MTAGKTQINMNKKAAIHVKNKGDRERKRARNVLGEVGWAPEHERLNMTPIMARDVTEDFMNERRRKPPLGSRKPPAAPVVGSGRSRAVAPNHEERAWLPGESRPYQVPEKDYSTGKVAYDDVSDPPSNKFEHQHKALGVDLSAVHPGQYCLIYENEVWPADNVEDIESAVEQVMRADPNVQDEELIVLHRLSIRVGVFVG